MGEPMAARKKDPPKPEEVDAEFVETTPVAPVRKAKVRSAQPAVEAEVVKAEPDEEGEAEPEDIEPAVDELQDVADEKEIKVKPSQRTGLARQDPLASYMAEVTKHPLLTQ